MRIENGIIAKEINILVQPPDNYYWNHFTEIHGISTKTTLNTPTLDKVWHQITPYIENQNVVAHNGFGFDFTVLNKTLDYYNLTILDYNKFCTYKIYRSNLATLCEEHNISLNHHDALSDVRVCAMLWLRSLNEIKNKI